MGYWNSRGLLGSSFETVINYTNEFYRQKGLAVIQKIPTPITPVEVDNAKHIISKAYFEKDSTVDYIGMAQGVGLCFDAKETKESYLPLRNVHAHQLAFMEAFEQQGGISFLLVHFLRQGEYYLLPTKELRRFWNRAAQGGRRSILREEFAPQLQVVQEKNGMINYLKAVNIILSQQSLNHR